MTTTIGVLGAGSWGASLASLLSQKGLDVTLWEYNPDQAKQLVAWRSLKFFPHLVIPKEITITSDLRETCENKDFIVVVVPSHVLRNAVHELSLLSLDLSRTTVVTATKGIENTSLKRMSEVIAEELPQVSGRIVALSGPTHAEEVIQRIPTVATVASLNQQAALDAQQLFLTGFFRIYTNTDIIGVEIGGAIKNIFSIAAGICDGLGLGDNTKAALVTRGLREMVSLGVKMGGQPSTFFGLAGLGDLVVTAFSQHSRNRALGEKVGKGKSLPDSEKELIMVAEGVKTTKSAYELGRKYGIELPIVEQVYEVLYNGKAPQNAVEELMMRETKPEAKLNLGELII